MTDATTFDDERLRAFAQGALDQHTPAKQDDNPYERCAECHYTRHPCDTYDLAAAVLRLIDSYDCGWHDGVDHGARHAEAELLATLRQARDDLDSHGAGPSYAYIDEILARYGVQP